MFPTFISILDIQSWWEVPSIAHFCSLFRTAFNLLDFDIEDLEEALLTDGTEESSWLQELIVRLLSGCLPNNEISTFNYQMFLRRLFRQKCQEHDRYNPFNTDCDFTLLPLRTKVDILHALCDFRLDAEDVLDQLKNLEADSLRVEPLGYDSNDSAYWYFYGTRLYREDFQKKNNKKKSIWQVICFTEDDWFQLTKKFKNSTSKSESALYHTLSKNFLPELPRLFKEKERQARRRLLENQPRRTSDRIRKLDIDTTERQETEESRLGEQKKEVEGGETTKKRKEQENRRSESYEKRSKLREGSEEGSQSESEPEERHEMAAKKRGRGRQRKTSSDTSENGKEITPSKRKKTRSSEQEEPPKPAKPATVGRQTNNSLSAADGQIVIQPAATATASKKKLKTSQVFQQTDEDLQVGMHKVLDYVKNHDDAWPFVDPVEEEYAPNYYSIIRRPMDLTRMEDRLDQGTYKTFDKFQSDFQLIVNNCRLYNGVENEYTEMVDNLLKVFEKATERYLDQISSSDEEIAVENLNSETETADPKTTPKHSKKKKHSESPPRTSNRGRKPVLAAQGKKRPRSPSEEYEESAPEEIVEEKAKKSKKLVKESKKALKLSKKAEKEKKENKKGEKETKENKKSEKETKENKKNDKEGKKADKEPRKMEKEAKGSKTLEREVKESKKLEREVKESKKPEKEVKDNKKTERELKESKKPDKDIKETKKPERELKEMKKLEKDVKDSKNHDKVPKENKRSEKDAKDKKGEKELKERKHEKVAKENKKTDKEIKESKKGEIEYKENKKEDKESRKLEEEKKTKKQGKNSKSKKDKLESKKENKVKEKEGRPKKRAGDLLGRKKKKASPDDRSRSRSFSTKSPSPSPARSVLSTPPPSSPECADFPQKTKLVSKASINADDLTHLKNPQLWETNPYFVDEPPPSSPQEGQLVDAIGGEEEVSLSLPFAFKPAKDKHNKLRETIEKLKAKSEISRMQTPVYDFEADDHLKENKDKNKKVEKEDKGKHKPKDKPLSKSKKAPHDEQEDGNSSQTESIKKPGKKKEQPAKIQELPPPPVLPKPPKQSNFDALSLATEQTLKDINKWLDDTPKFADFSSASNSPSYLALDDFDLLGTPKPEPKKVEKVLASVTSGIAPAVPGAKKDGTTAVAKEGKKKPFRDPSKFFNKRREVQRTIDRLQPGKGKGNLITSVQSAIKPDEIFPLGPLSKIKDTKNSLIVKTDTNAPKLSLGSVLDSFGKHKFVDDPKKDEEEEEEGEKVKVDAAKVSEEPKVEPKPEEGKEEKKVLEVGAKVEKDVKESKPAEEPSPGGPTPNLSAWFKAFGAPKAPPPQKKSENSKPEAKDEESTAKSERVPVPDPSPSLDSPQPVARQRRISTGSSMSERSSFSQDLDSPRVGIDERGAYPAPYPSPLHRSPSGASPVMASPRPDISPRSAYPFNGQMRVGFYQDTVSNKSSPDKSCSPRDNPQGTPYYPPGDHVYAPNTTQNSIYSYANTPYYTHAPNYSSTNPTPPYNMDGSSSAYYDTSKVGAEHLMSKPSQNYTANSPASSQASPAAQPQLSPHSPIVHSQASPSLHSQQSSVHSPSMHSPSMHSPSVHSPSMHSPNVNSPSMHSPSMHSPSIHSQHSPSVNSPQLHSPNPGLHSPSLSVHSPQMSVMSPQMSVVSPQMGVVSPQMGVVSPQMGVMSPQMSVVSPQVNSPGLHSPMGVNSPHPSQVNSPINLPSVEQFHSQQEDGSNSGSGDSKGQQNLNQNQPVFPVKKRAFVDSDLSQFAALQEELVNRNLQMGHQLSLNPSAKADSDVKQPSQTQQQHLLQQQLQQQMQKQQQQMQKHQLQQVQEQLLQQAQLQQQKSQQLLQQAHLQQQVQLQQQKSQQQAQQQLQKGPQQVQQQAHQQHLQKNPHQQLLQQQASIFSKTSDSSLRTPSPPLQQQGQQAAMSQQQLLSQQQALTQPQQQGQRNQQQVPAHSNSESASASIRNMPYPPVTAQSNPYASNYANRDAFPLNIPSAHSMQQHQPKLDMSKFTNMGYTGPEVNFSRALQQQYGRPELSYTRTTVQSAISQASQLLSSQSLTASQPSASSASSLPGYQKQATNQQQAHSGNYQSNRSVDSVAERLAAQAQQEAAASYKPDARSTYNSSTIDLDQALGLSRNISNLPNIVDRYSNEQRMMAGLQSSSNPYYTDKGLGTSHMFNKTMSSASQIFSQANMAAMNSYTQSMQQTSAASMYNRQINELQAQAAQAATAQAHPELKSSAQAVSQDRKNRKKKSNSKSGTTSDASQANSTSSAATAAAASGSAQGFQSYAGLKGPPAASAAANMTGAALEPGAISLKTSSVVPGSAFNFGPAAPGALGLGSGLYGDKDTYSNFLEDFRTAPNFYMAAAAAHHRSTPESGAGGKGSQPGSTSQTYPSFLNPAHQSRTPGYPGLAGPFIPPSAQAQLMDTSSQLYQHYLQAGVLNQGLLGAPGAYPPGYHPALAMRQPYDSMSRPSWL